MMGRNRKGIEVERSFGSLKKVDVITKNELYTKIEFCYSVIGIGSYIMELNISNYNSKIEFNLKIGKDTSYLPENVFLELPIANIERDILFLKGNEEIKSREYQLPGTLIDFYSVYEGIKVRGASNFSIATSRFAAYSCR